MSIVTTQNDQLVTTTLIIATETGNEHASIIKMVRIYQADLEEFGLVDFKSESSGGRPTEYAELNEQQSTLILTYMRNSEMIRAFKKRLVKEFWTMRSAAAKPVALSTMDILKIAMESEQGRLVAIEQRDHAIATKAQIGSKREATAMVRVAIANKEVARLKDQLGFGSRQATILQVNDATGMDYNFLPLRNWCNANEVVAEIVPDKRYPKGVRAWPTNAWMDCYGVDIVKLFGAAA